MSHRSSFAVAGIAVALGLGALVGGLASAQEEPKPYLACRFQEQTAPFTLLRFPTQEEAVRGIVGREVDLGDGPLEITVLAETVTEDEDRILLVGINGTATAYLSATSEGYAVSGYRTCAVSPPPDSGSDS